MNKQSQLDDIYYTLKNKNFISYDKNILDLKINNFIEMYSNDLKQLSYNDLKTINVIVNENGKDIPYDLTILAQVFDELPNKK